MDRHIVVPIAIFVCITFALKFVIDAYVRRKTMDSSPEVMRLLMESEKAGRQQSSLRWGLVLIAMAAGLGLLGILDLSESTPGFFAILFAATGLGNLAYFFCIRRLT